jgi:hypothetical protein
VAKITAVLPMPAYFCRVYLLSTALQRASLLVSAHNERYDNQIPADDGNIDEVHNPETPSHCQHQEHSNQFAHHHSAHLSEVSS